MLSNLPLVGRLFGGDVSFSTLEDAQQIVEGLQAEFSAQSQAMAEAEAMIAEMEARRVRELREEVAQLEGERRALAAMAASVEERLAVKKAALAEFEEVERAAESEVEGGLLPYALLRQNDDETTNAVIETFGDVPLFEAKSREATESLLRRDAEDDEKLAAGIALAVDRGVLEAGVEVEPVTRIDVTGRSADEVADAIYAACGDERGKIVVLQGLSGTGKGTTVSKLLTRFDSCVSWSNGNVFRALTLLALERCAAEGVDLDDSVLTADNLAAWISMLRFDLFPEGYDIEIDGEGVNARVSAIANTALKDPRIARSIPTVAGFAQVRSSRRASLSPAPAQGEVVTFANAALQRMRQDGLTCVVEGRAPTLAYVRSPFRFELVIDDPLLLGARRVAQRVVALALKDLAPRTNGHGPPQDSVDRALQTAIRAL